jgi:hypothetical protein
MVDTGEVTREADVRPGLAPLPWRPVLLVAVAVGVVHLAVARALRLRTTGAWSVVGMLAAIGTLNKETVVGLLLGIAVALVVLHRDVLRTPGPWLAGALAVLGALPYVLWNAVNGWPTLKMAGVLADRQGGMLAVLAHIPEILIVLAGPPLIALWVIGVRWLLSQALPHRSPRWPTRCHPAR